MYITTPYKVAKNAPGPKEVNRMIIKATAGIITNKNNNAGIASFIKPIG